MFKRGYTGIYHKMSPKPLNRYVTEFAGRQNYRESDTIDQMGWWRKDRSESGCSTVS